MKKSTYVYGYGRVDVGDSIVFNVDMKGSEIARSYQEWDSFYPSPVMVEQDAAVWCEAAADR